MVKGYLRRSLLGSKGVVICWHPGDLVPIVAVLKGSYLREVEILYIFEFFGA